MTENEKLRALLTEARSALDMWTSSWASDRTDLFPRIDAALAEPVREARQPVEWRIEGDWYVADLPTGERLCVTEKSDYLWFWSVHRTPTSPPFDAAYCSTLERAQAKAIDAALAEPVVPTSPVMLPVDDDADAAFAKWYVENHEEKTSTPLVHVTEVQLAQRERDEARAVLSALCSELEGALATADWQAAFTGVFASATQLPSAVSRMRWWAREMRRVIGEGKS